MSMMFVIQTLGVNMKRTAGMLEIWAFPTQLPHQEIDLQSILIVYANHGLENSLRSIHITVYKIVRLLQS